MSGAPTSFASGMGGLPRSYPTSKGDRAIPQVNDFRVESRVVDQR